HGGLVPAIGFGLGVLFHTGNAFDLGADERGECGGGADGGKDRDDDGVTEAADEFGSIQGTGLSQNDKDGKCSYIKTEDCADIEAFHDAIGDGKAGKDGFEKG